MDTVQNTTSGYRPSWVFAMAVGAAIGWGAFVLPFEWLVSGGVYGSTLGFVIGAMLVTIVGLSYGAAIERYPVTGGAVAYALAAFGRKHAVIAGWSLALGYVSIVALNASAVTLVFRMIAPHLTMRVPLYSVAGWDIYLVEVLLASVFLIVFAVLSSRHAAFSGRFQLGAVVVMACAVLFLLLASMMVGGEGLAAAPAFPPDANPEVAILSIVAIVPWAYVGFDSIPQLAGEFSFSPRKATSLLVWGVFGATAIYIAMIAVTAMLAGDDLQALSNSAWPPAEAVASNLGLLGTVVMVVAVSAGVVTGINGFYIASSRVLLTMGKMEILPRSFTKLDAKAGVPKNAVLAVMAVCLVSPWFGRAALSWIVDMASAGITVSYIYTCAAVLKMGLGKSLLGRPITLEKRPYLIVIGSIGSMIGLGFLVLLFFPGAPGNLQKPAWIALLVWIGVASMFYLLRRSRILSVPEDRLVQHVLNK